MAIRTPDQRLRVFISSTLGELAAERQAVSHAITALRLTPVMFEAGARPHPPQEVYRAYLAQSDVFIGLYWQRYGQVNPDMQVSGLEEELALARGRGMPRLLYVKTPAPDREPRLAELLARIRDETSYRRFRTPAELGRLVRDDLAALLSERFVSGGEPAAAPRRPAARPEAQAEAPRSPSWRGPGALPATTTSLVDREQAIDEAAELLGRPEVRLVTLTGPGGVGKTRLAVAVAERLRGRFASGSAFVPLASVTQRDQMLASIARAVGAELGWAGAPLEVLVELFGDDPWLLLLDNLEQVVDAAQDLGELLARCPGVVLLATTRTVLGLQAEREYPVPPLPLPADPAEVPLEELASSPAVALFVGRARAVRHDFALTWGNAAAVVEICRRLEGLPLAIELAAARSRLLEPEEILRRLARSLDTLGTGAMDLPQRQRTLRATVEWSVGLLDEDERSLLEILAVFVDGWTIQAASRVAEVGEERALELCEALARHSLVQSDSTEDGPRLRMLETIREFVAERLDARPDAAGIGRRHADYYRALAELADRPLRGIGQSEWAQRLEPDAGNLAAAVRWYLANDPRPVPHLFRILLLFWFLRDHMSDARPWIDQLLPAAESFGHQARAELFWTAALNATEVGDDATARSARERLLPLLAGLGDPYLHAVSRFAIAGLSALLGDVQGALRVALASLEELRGLDEPFWTALAAFTVGSTETGLGRFDDALGHLLEVRDLAERLDNALLAAWSLVQLGTLEVMRGRPAEAHALLSEGMERSLGMRNTRTLTMSLAAFGRLAFEEGDAERAALLVGAAEGLRRRVGLRAWPMLRRGGAVLGTEIREALGADRFDQVFASGTRLTQREAVAAVRGAWSSAEAQEAQSALRGPRRRVM